MVLIISCLFRYPCSAGGQNECLFQENRFCHRAQIFMNLMVIWKIFVILHAE